MRACKPFRKFIEIESNFPQSEMYEPYSRGILQDFPKGVRDFLYLPEYKSAFIAQSDMNLVTRMDSYFTNFTMPWEKKGKDKNTNSVLTEEAVSTVGAL